MAPVLASTHFFGGTMIDYIKLSYDLNVEIRNNL